MKKTGRFSSTQPQLQTLPRDLGKLAEIGLMYNFGPVKWQHVCCVVGQDGLPTMVNFEELEPRVMSLKSWWCNKCSVEVYGARCLFCGKSKKEKA